MKEVRSLNVQFPFMVIHSSCFGFVENDSQEHIVASDCPLAVDHIKQGMTNMEPTLPRDKIKTKHPVQILAEAYGLKY
jgi:Fe-S oxidoreductase